MLVWSICNRVSAVPHYSCDIGLTKERPDNLTGQVDIVPGLVR